MSKVVRSTGLERIELERLRIRVGRLFAALQEVADEVMPPAPGAWTPPVDLSESNDAVTLHVELPGVSAAHIEIKLTTTQLTISGKKKRGAPRGVISHLCSERNYGSFTRIVPLRWPIRVREATAELKNGVLTVRLPKLEERRGAQFIVPVEEVY